MKNKEFYRDEIFEIACERNVVAVVNGEPVGCADLPSCDNCDFSHSTHRCKSDFFEWLEKEHEEIRIHPEVKKLKKDDRVLVSSNGKDWIKRHFEKYDQEKNVVYVYTEGATSWTENQGSLSWKYAKLPEDEKQEIDWESVPVDTKILVKERAGQEWKPRYFAKYENGKVYAWTEGKTSNETETYWSWRYAKLAEE